MRVISLKKSIVAIALFFLALVPVSVALPGQALAYNPLEDACSQSGAAGSVTCANKDGSDQKITGADSIIIRVTRLVALFAGIAAVIVIVIYGLQLIFAYGDTSKATAARNAILAAVIGLVVIGVAQAIVVFLVRNL